MTDDDVKLNKMDKKHGSTVGRPRKKVVKSPKKNAPDSGDVSNIDYCACKEYKDEELSLECDSCHKYWHLCCVGLKGMDMNMVALLANWKCPDCFTCPHSYFDRPSMPSSVKVMVRDELHAIQPMIKATVEDAVRNVMSNTVCSKEDIKDVVKSYAAVTQESQNKVIQQAAVAQSSKTVVESVVRQLDADKVEREKRRCNVVVLSAPEPKKESSTEKKRKEDMQFCSRVLEIPLTDIEVCWRAGKVDESKPEYCRPLIIKLKDEELVKEWTKDGVPTLERGDGSRTSGPADSAEVLAEAFSSVFVHEPENLPDVEMPEGNCDILNDIDISFDKVKHELETLNCFKSYGPDNIHPKLLQSLADDSSFVDAVVELFRECTDSAAFDTINHRLLLNNLQRLYGINDVAINWLSSYLSNRSYKVVVNQKSSGECLLEIGVPQGSILGPLLFILYTKDLESIVTKFGFTIHLYADDTQIYFAFDVHSDSPDMQAIDLCCSEVKKWMATNFLKLNEDKTEFIEIGPYVSPITSLRIAGTELKPVDKAKNLGFLFDHQMNLDAQINAVFQVCYMNRRDLTKIGSKLSHDLKVQMVHSNILCFVDYCNSVY
ncbi:hypothetical protein ACHWQZ_G000006, partial [Mnemiopsis leidyi]